MAAVFIVNADDLGVSRGATLGIIRAHLNGVVTSASIAPTGVDYLHALEATRTQCPELGIGLHFTLSNGRPVSDPEDVPLLVDQNGQFRWEFLSLLRSIRWKRDGELLHQIKIELEAQIQRLLADGVIPDHVNSERHVHLIPGIFDIVVEAARRHHIPFVRAGRDLGPSLIRPRHLKPAMLHGGILKYLLLQGLTRLDRDSCLNTRHCENFASYIFTGRIDLVLNSILLSKPKGVTEIMVHPGIPEESIDVNLGNPGLEHYLALEDRRLELNACIAARALSPGVDLCTFDTLAKR